MMIRDKSSLLEGDFFRVHYSEIYMHLLLMSHMAADEILPCSTRLGALPSFSWSGFQRGLEIVLGSVGFGVLEEEILPERFGVIIPTIVPILKSGGPKDRGNYHTIMTGHTLADYMLHS